MKIQIILEIEIGLTFERLHNIWYKIGERLEKICKDVRFGIRFIKITYYLKKLGRISLLENFIGKNW